MTNKIISFRSNLGLNAANFFLAEMVGVILPFLAVFLKQHNWTYDQVGIVVALGGLGTFCFQTSAGIISDRVSNKRILLAGSSIILGVSYGITPLIVDNTLFVYLASFIAGVATTFFVPLLAALALSLAGHNSFDRLMGVNQSWNHIGNIFAAILALILVKVIGITSIFYVVALVSFLAAFSVYIISENELKGNLTQKNSLANEKFSALLKHIASLFKDNKIRILIVSVTLFHFANAPIMPLVGLYLKHLGGGNEQVAWVVFVAQIVTLSQKYF